MMKPGSERRPAADEPVKDFPSVCRGAFCWRADDTDRRNVAGCRGPFSQRGKGRRVSLDDDAIRPATTKDALEAYRGWFSIEPKRAKLIWPALFLSRYSRREQEHGPKSPICLMAPFARLSPVSKRSSRIRKQYGRRDDAVFTLALNLFLFEIFVLLFGSAFLLPAARCLIPSF